MIIKILAVLGIVFIFFCISIAIAVLSTGLRGDYYRDPEEDREQAEYIKEWIRKHDSH